MAVKAESELNKKKRFLPSATFSNNKLTFNFKVAQLFNFNQVYLPIDNDFLTITQNNSNNKI